MTERARVAESVGSRVRALRRHLGMSQAALVGPGLTASYLSLIESGKRVPSDAVVAHLAQRLGCTTEHLLGDGPPDLSREHELELRYAELALQSGEAAEAADRFRRLVRAVPAGSVRRRAELGLARALEAAGRLEEAIAAYERLRERGRSDVAADDVRVAIALCRCYREAGDLGRSIDLGEAAHDRLTSLGLAATEGAIELACTLAGAYYERGDLARAQYLMQRTVEQAERVPGAHARAAAYWEASVVAHGTGRLVEAVELAERAVALLGEGEDRRHLGRARVAHAWLLLRVSPPEPTQALALLRRAEADLTQAGSAVDVAYWEAESARAHLLLGDAVEARRLAEGAVTRLGGAPRLEAASALVVLAAAAIVDADPARAVGLADQAAAQLAAMGSARQAATAWRELAGLLERAGRAEAARDARDRALDCAGVRAAALDAPVGRLGASRRDRSEGVTSRLTR